MDTSASFAGLFCIDCGDHHAPHANGWCRSCGGPMTGRYDYDAISLTRESLENRRFDGITRYAAILPFETQQLTTLAEGTTPLVEAPTLADDTGVGSLAIKDEGRNPSGTTRDRAMAMAVTAAHEQGATEVVLPTTGDGGQSAAAYAARAGLDVDAFVPTRSTFVAKAMTNVHGGEMSVVEGRYPDAVNVFESAMADRDDGSLSVAPGGTPYRHEGLKTLCYEVAEQRDWELPDSIVIPTAHGETIVGTFRALEELADLGLTAGLPALHVAQPEDCAPIVRAWRSGAAEPDTWDRPDTLVGALEVPGPALGGAALDAIRETGGCAVAVSDDAALESAVALATEGVEASATGGVGAAAVDELAEDGHVGADDDVVVVNPVAGNKENDVLRSHLMRKGA